MEASRAAGSPREEEEKENETLPRDPGHPPSSFSVDRALHWVTVTYPLLLRSWFPAQTASASSPPSAQTQAMQENETLNEENPQPNEQPQEDEYVIQKERWEERAALQSILQPLPLHLLGGQENFVVFSDFTIQVRVTGRTGGCEKDFLKEVADHLWKHEICLQTEDYREDSSHFLLIFCPVATSVGSDIANALEGLGSEPKAVLVLLHHKVRESTSYVNTKEQAQHPAVVRTVHARYLLDDGFYACQMNKEAVVQVAEALKDHWKDS
ncbi:uncharacterized protein [Anolis sagrei]|uniref:uncharacterized protein n=1 Tax=Anolis sagrei TaxID=38937 RepID=UPI0035221E20